MVLSAINKNAKITKETINNKDHYVIKDVVPVVDDVVMNNGLYPKDEIDKSYLSINGNLMPIGHPKVDGQHVSANNPKAINEYYGGAWAENVRKDGDRVLMDTYVDIEFASNHAKGKQLIERLDSMVNGENADPIHVSTGLVLNKVQKSGKSKGKSYSWVATNMQFDHVAILLNEQGAATPDDGVGIFVNAEGEHEIETARLINTVDYTRSGILGKFRIFMGNDSDMSFDDIYSLISEKLSKDKKSGDSWPYICSIYPKYIIYQFERSQYKQQYHIDESQKVNFVGEAVEVKKTVTYDEIKTNGENQAMKDKILQALNAKGIKTDGLTDEQLLTAYNEQAEKDALAKKKEKEKGKKEKEEEEKKEKAQNSDMPEWAQSLSDRFNALEKAVNKNQDAEVTAMRGAVKEKFGMSDTAVNALNGEALTELYAKCQSSTSVSPASAVRNSNQSLCEMPE